MSIAAEWITIAYSLPAEPSRKRVAIWRRMKKLGAVYLNEGFWFLPKTDALLDAIRDIVEEVRVQGGSASAFLAAGILPGQGEFLRARFSEARDEEYDEILRQCQRFLAHIERETEAEHFDFAAVEELEEDLEKRRRWLDQVKRRDVLGVEGRQAVERSLGECREALDRFTEEAYKREG